MNFLHRPGVESAVMKRILHGLVLVVLVLASTGWLQAEKVSDLPAPTGYVNDFAGVLSPSTRASVEDLCIQVDRQAHAQIAVVTIKTLDNDVSVEEFATALEEKWKVGAKGTDRGVLMLLVMTPRRGRIEVGYGLEGILNDAKVGDIGRSMVPAATQGDYNTAVPLGVRQIAQVIATDAGVTLTSPYQTQHTYRREAVQEPIHLSFLQVVLGGGLVLVVLFILIRTGNIGILFFILGNLMGGGGGGGGRGDRDGGGGGGFGGFGGGSSGGGGASGDF
jgi:uncharacterized protein